MVKNFLLVGLGGGVGSMIRFGMYILFKNQPLPYTTLLINVCGSLLIGILMGFGLRDTNFEYNWKLFLATGVCGGFTTFSAFSIENVMLLQQGKYVFSAVYIIASLMAGVISAWLGFKLATH